MYYYLLAAIMLFLDQCSKYAISHNMTVGEQVTLIPNVLYITSSRNTGAAWNILEGKMWFFYIISIVVLAAVVYYMQKVGRHRPLLGVSLGFILGGTLGNFLDRIFRGEVVDFIHVYIGSYSYPVFNIADSSLVVGVILILIFTLLDGKKEKKHGRN
ncbi:lipoprotein signal peptidase [Pullulanibacillus camelliae]|uniref:Lipoprotein signal peptidase n=1 Tax=Pullulanibacillus camelliae TaxID=1707096 RepID=A0A8J2VW00_9BACL|nr:signal peptidase II [Pullulanibacillus camelliae]GGE41520.1 lipoprotein signal peptidase [Pullulanibacillus camelliae]